MTTAESVSAILTTNRNCTVEITNGTAYYLINPKVYMASGYSHHPPQPTVITTKTEVCSFTKDDNTATGAVGLLTYDLFDMNRRAYGERVAIMFSVPYDYNLYKNRMAVGVVPRTQDCDKHLHNRMYDGKDVSNFTRSDVGGTGVHHCGGGVDVRATMSSVGKAILKVDIYVD